MGAYPDVIDKRVPEYCNDCGSDLSGVPQQLVGKRQLIDIPPIVSVVTEQQVFKRTCTCGHTAEGCFSANANAPVGYGESIEGLVAYWSMRLQPAQNRKGASMSGKGRTEESRGTCPQKGGITIT